MCRCGSSQMKILWGLLLLPLGCSAISPLEEVVMYEVTTKPYSSSSVVVEVGGAVGDVQLSLTRNNESNTLSGLQLEYGDVGTVVLEREILDCIPDPVIEAPMFYYSELGSRDTIPSDWFSSVRIPFAGGRIESEPIDDSIVISLYPSIEFEFIGFKLNRIKIRKSSTEVRSVKDITGQCPHNLINWVQLER